MTRNPTYQELREVLKPEQHERIPYSVTRGRTVTADTVKPAAGQEPGAGAGNAEAGKMGGVVKAGCK